MEVVSESDLPKLRRSLVNRLVPTSLIPIATATGFLVLGTHKKAADCFFPLPTFLMWAGVISISISVAGTVGRYIIDWVIRDKVVTAGERIMFLGLENLDRVLSLIQLIIIVVGASIIFPHLPHWQSQHKNLPNYCDHGMVVFSAVFFGISIFIVMVTILLGVFISCDKERKQGKKERTSI